jgi:hypothetical protein
VCAEKRNPAIFVVKSGTEAFEVRRIADQAEKPARPCVKTDRSGS